MMKKSILAAIAALGLMSSTTWAQVDLGGTISGAINQATGGAQAAAQKSSQAGTQVGGQAAVQAGTQATGQAGLQAGGQASAQSGLSGVNTGSNASGASAGTANQSWLGRVGNDLRGAMQQAENGTLRLQNNLNQTLQQHGLRSGDQLLDANGQPLTQSQWDQFLQSNPSQLRVLRNGQTVVINGHAQGSTSGSGQWNGSNNQGVMQTGGRQRFGITMNPSNDSVVVSGVVVGSPAALAGLRPGDQIIAINGQQVSSPNAMIQLVGSSNANQTLDVQFRRNGQDMQSQVMLASNAAFSGQRPGAYQAGYASGVDAYSGSNGQAVGDVNQRIAQLEQLVQQLRNEVRQLKGGNATSNADSNN